MSNANNLINPYNLLPSNLKDTDLFGKIVDLLNNLMSDYGNTIAQIKKAYLDTLYKISDYNQISYGAKLTYLEDQGYGYIMDALELSEDQLVKLIIFLDLIYVLKGTIPGLKLVLDTLSINATYELWDKPGIDQLTGNVIEEVEEDLTKTTSKGQPFTAQMQIMGATFDQYANFTKVRDFLRSYMLPYMTIEITMTYDGPTTYVAACMAPFGRIKWNKIFSYSTDVQDVAVYDLGNGYDVGKYGYRSSGVLQITTVTIRPIPEDATVSIRGIVGNVQIVPQNTLVEYRVEKEGYITQTGTIQVRQSPIVRDVYLEERGTGVLFTIIPSPSDSTVRINNEYTNSLEVPFNSTVTWSVSRTGYQTQSGSTAVAETNVTTNISLTPEAYTLAITPNPSNATVLINNTPGNTYRADYNTQLTWHVSADGYETQTGTVTLTSDINLPVVLERTRVGFSVIVNTNDDDEDDNSSEVITYKPYTVYIFGVEQQSVLVLPGQQVAWEVRAHDGYTPVSQSGVETVYEDTGIIRDIYPPLDP